MRPTALIGGLFHLLIKQRIGTASGHTRAAHGVRLRPYSSDIHRSDLNAAPTSEPGKGQGGKEDDGDSVAACGKLEAAAADYYDSGNDRGQAQRDIGNQIDDRKHAGSMLG